MKFVSSEKFRRDQESIFEAAENEEIVLTSLGQPVALLVGIEGEDPEEIIRFIRRARAQTATLKMRKIAARSGMNEMSPEEVDEEVRAVRDQRGRRR